MVEPRAQSSPPLARTPPRPRPQVKLDPVVPEKQACDECGSTPTYSALQHSFDLPVSAPSLHGWSPPARFTRSGGHQVRSRVRFIVPGPQQGAKGLANRIARRPTMTLSRPPRTIARRPRRTAPTAVHCTYEVSRQYSAVASALETLHSEVVQLVNPLGKPLEPFDPVHDRSPGRARGLQAPAGSSCVRCLARTRRQHGDVRVETCWR